MNSSTASIIDKSGILLFIAWRNIWRNPIRSLLTISALAGGLVMVILYSALLEGMTRQMVQYATEITTGHIQVHRQAFIDDQDIYATLPWSYLEKIENKYKNIQLAPRIYAAGLASANQMSAGAMIKAVDPQREIAVTKMLQHVRQGKVDLSMADPSADGLSRYNIVVGSQLAKNFSLNPGDELVLVTQAADGSIGNALYIVAGVLKPLEPNFDRMGVLMSIKAYQELMYLQDGFHELTIKVNDITRLDSTQSALTAELNSLMQQHPLDAIGGNGVVRSWRQIMPAISDMLELSKSMLLIIGFIVVGLASLGILNTMLMAVHERSHEFGILLAIGMKRRLILLMVICESFFLSIISAVFGVLISLPLVDYFETHGIDFSQSMPDGYDWGGMVFEPIMKGQLNIDHVIQACILMIIVSVFASLFPSWRTLKLKPAEVIK